MIILNARLTIPIAIIISLILLITIPATSSATSELPKNHVTYLAFGDSITEGLLESRVLSESGGYYEYIVEALISKGYKIQSTNFAKSGATSAEIIDQLHYLENYPNGVDMLTVSMGLNDLRPYLYTLSDKSFQKEVANAHATLNIFQENVEETAEHLEAVEQTFRQLKKDLESLQLFIDTTNKLIKRKPVNSNTKDVNEQVARMENLSITIENTLEIIKSTKNKLILPKENIDEYAFNELKKELKTVTRQLTIMNTNVGLTLNTLTREKFSVHLGDTTLKVTQQAEKHIKTIKDTTSEGKGHLNASYKSLNKVIKSLKKVPAAQEVIKKSVNTIDNVFDQANQELSNTGTNIATFINHARKNNPDLDIYILGYYNPKPYASGSLQEKMITLITNLNDTIENTALSSNATFIPSFDAFDGRYEKLLPNPNNIHPSQAGYEVLAEQFIVAMDSNYPTVSNKMMKENDTTDIIEQAERNVAMKSKDNNKANNIVKYFQSNYVLLVFIIGITLILAWAIRTWQIRNKRLF